MNLGYCAPEFIALDFYYCRDVLRHCHCLLCDIAADEDRGFSDIPSHEGTSQQQQQQQQQWQMHGDFVQSFRQSRGISGKFYSTVTSFVFYRSVSH